MDKRVGVERREVQRESEREQVGGAKRVRIVRVRCVRRNSGLVEERVKKVACDLWYSFFFFQAEDGIRDIGVTGVQTCALPISLRPEPCQYGGMLERLSQDPSRARLLPPGRVQIEYAGVTFRYRLHGGRYLASTSQDRKSVV